VDKDPTPASAGIYDSKHEPSRYRVAPSEREQVTASTSIRATPKVVNPELFIVAQRRSIGWVADEMPVSHTELIVTSRRPKPAQVVSRSKCFGSCRTRDGAARVSCCCRSSRRPRRGLPRSWGSEKSPLRGRRSVLRFVLSGGFGRWGGDRAGVCQAGGFRAAAGRGFSDHSRRPDVTHHSQETDREAEAISLCAARIWAESILSN
jgi:hypothetical protein